MVQSVQTRLAAQNELITRQWDDDMKASPETATAYGDYRYNALLSDYSLAAAAKQNDVDRAYRVQLAAISIDGFPEQDRLSHDLFLHLLDQRIADSQQSTSELLGAARSLTMERLKAALVVRCLLTRING